jgi:hypothetical protein
MHSIEVTVYSNLLANIRPVIFGEDGLIQVLVCLREDNIPTRPH